MRRLRHLRPEAVFTHRVQCLSCLREFELLSAAWCAHTEEPSKICPYCERCVCDHADYRDPRLWVEAPVRFRQRGFRRLFAHYL